ncbi:DnaJ domain-containing protein [Microbacterium sp. STN6]|uniref:J domain-containing protein n=1 Tax=Microbacterium sp. STN6 TaxID=2995588 RepID=UPI002260FC6D|nr:DnaJ domain-containing protein [Microbacterium sp. STN6]MCX7521472.1 DnaJ domain-containing protein [Microbacterium sp. STN6]
MPESPATPTPYEVLGMSASASQDELRRAYRRLLRETHPDTGGSAERFQAVQHAWERVGDPARRAAYDRGSSSGTGSDFDADSPGYSQGTDAAAGARPAGTSSSGHSRPRGSSSPRARTYGHPGGHARERFLALMQEWSGRGSDLDDPYDPALVRSAPLEIRRLLAKALAEEATARSVTALGIGYTLWSAVATDDPGYVIDHIVLGPAGLFALRSEDWGASVRLVKGEVAGEGLALDDPIKTLVRAAKRLARSLGVRFTGYGIVVPDEALDASMETVDRGRNAGAALVGRSLLPLVLRTGAGATVDIADVFEVRTRLQNGLRLV